MTAETTFQVTSWEEDAIQEFADGAKITRAHVTQTYSGSIEGEGAVEYVMFHKGDGSAVFVGIERVVGAVGGRSGRFVLQHSGVFDGGSAKSSWLVVAGAGTEELQGLKGSGSFVAGHDMKGTVTLDLSFGPPAS